MKITEKLKSMLKKGNALREYVEDVIGEKLEALAKNDKVAEREKSLIKIGLKAAVTYISAQSGKPISLKDDQYDSIAEAIVTKHNDLRVIVAKQLEK